MKFAIIGGSGKMGQWFARFLKQEGMTVFISGKNQEKLQEISQRLELPAGSNREIVSQADVIILSVPVGNFENVAMEIAPCLQPWQIVIDITSIKEMPVDTMHRYFAENLVLGTHPLFGPGARSVAGMNFVLTPTDSREQALAQKAREFLVQRGARVTFMSPRDHDKMMCIILGLSHFVALVTADVLSEKYDLELMKSVSGISFKVLLTLVESVVSEDPELYSAIQMSLKDLPEIEASFVRKAQEWAELVRDHEKDRFIVRMDYLKKFFEKGADFGKSYDEMYRLVNQRNDG